MPIPAKHLTALKGMLAHHQLIIKFGTDPKVRAALNELSDDYDLRKRISKDPMAYIKSKKIALPRGAKVSFREFSPRWKIGVEWDGHGAGYDSDGGFYCH
jgi:hypothetical protein